MRRSWRCMAALLLMIMILVSGGCQNIRHLSVSQSEKDDADTGTGSNEPPYSSGIKSTVPSGAGRRPPVSYGGTAA